uniref:Uncharacterized protein n=1 Tax=Anguilla anguilla TaxID=7936 RepID=A0A0E9WBB7_ANGAN
MVTHQPVSETETHLCLSVSLQGLHCHPPRELLNHQK